MEPQELRLDFQKVKFYWRQTFFGSMLKKGVEIPEIQWEEYFLIAISFMFLNLVGHAASFHLDAIGRHHTQKMVNKLLVFFDGLPMPSLETSRWYGENNGFTWGHMGISEVPKKIE